MQFLTLINIAVLATSVIASPTYGHGTTGGHSKNTCGNGQAISCCNAGDSHQALGGILGLVGGILSPGSCMPISVPVIGGSLQDLCGNNNAQCCDSKQDGLINLNVANCLPLGLN